MAIEFDNESPDWTAEGEKPDDSLKSTGFQAGYKPPASIFNWFWTKVSSCISELQSKLSNIDDEKAPVDHASTDTVYGVGDADNYGHLKLTDSVSSSYSTSSGLAATPAAVQTRAPKSHRSSTTDYGTGNSNYYGHVKLSDDVTDSTHQTGNGIAATPYAVSQAYSAATAAQMAADSAQETADGKAPTYHASTEEIYGIGDRDYYGHVMLADEIDSTSSADDGGVAASPYAVKKAYDAATAAQTTADGKAPKFHRSTDTTYGAGAGNYYGHVKLSNDTSSTSGVDGGTAATPYAVKQAIAKSEAENYYPEYHADDIDSTTNFYLDCANVDNAGTALFKASARGVTNWRDLVSGCAFSLSSADIESDGIKSTGEALTATLSSYAGFNTETSFTILFDACIPQLSSSNDTALLFQLGSNRRLQIQQRGVDGIRLVTYDEDSTAHVYPDKLESGSELDGGTYTTGHYVVPLNDTFSGQGYGSYQHFAVVFDTSASTVTWYQNGSVYSTTDMEDTYVKVDGGYTATILENEGMGLRYFKIVRSAMTATEVAAYMTAHPHTNYTGQPKTQYDNKLLDLEEGLRYFGTCESTSSTTAKIVTVDDGFVLKTGARVAVKFSNTNTTSSATLNVNSTGKKTIYLNSTTTSSANTWAANDVIEFIYDGTYWRGVVNNIANGTKYGRIRLSDSTTSTSSTSGGYAATPYAVRQVYNAVRQTATYVVAASDSYGYNYADYKCDGTEDESEINTAISAANTAGGGTVVLLEGTYVISGSIAMLSNVTLQGQGAGTILKRSFNNSYYYQSAGVVYCNGKSDCIIRDLAINGNRSNYTGTSNNGILLIGGTHNTVENVVVYDTYYGVCISGSETHSLVHNAHIYDCDKGIDIYNGSYNAISECFIHDITDSGIWIDYCPTYNSIVNNSVVNAVKCIHSGSSKAGYNSIIDNTLYPTTPDDDTDTYGIYWVYGYYGVITGNTINGGTYNIYASSSNSNTISDNQLLNATNYGMYISGTWNRITNNEIIPTGVAAIYVFNSNSKYNIISGNSLVCDNCSSDGIYFAGSYSNISNNYIYDGNQIIDGIYVTGTRNNISGNSSYGCYRGIYLTSAATYSLVTGNLAYNADIAAVTNSGSNNTTANNTDV